MKEFRAREVQRAQVFSDPHKIAWLISNVLTWWVVADDPIWTARCLISVQVLINRLKEVMEA